MEGPDCCKFACTGAPVGWRAMTEPFRHRLRVRWSECDLQGVVFYPNYLTYFDHTITELWREAIGPYQEMVERGVDIVVAEANVRYFSPARFDDEIDIGVEVVRLGTTALSTRMTVERDGDLLAEGLMRHVFVDVAAGGKTEIPADIRSALTPYLAEAAEAAS
jgi:acyl-CoA thioester hydrolase